MPRLESRHRSLAAFLVGLSLVLVTLRVLGILSRGFLAGDILFFAAWCLPLLVIADRLGAVVEVTRDGVRSTGYLGPTIHRSWDRSRRIHLAGGGREPRRVGVHGVVGETAFTDKQEGFRAATRTILEEALARGIPIDAHGDRELATWLNEFGLPAIAPAQAPALRKMGLWWRDLALRVALVLVLAGLLVGGMLGLTWDQW